MSSRIDNQVCLIVPAYNEAKSIALVLQVAVSSGMFEKIICVDDGSDDSTSEMASRIESVCVIKQKNAGKALAMRRGLAEANDTAIICFLDADLIELTTDHIKNLVEPVVKGASQATIGIFSGGRGATDFAQRVAPLISGQRCLLRSLLDDFDDWHVRFGIEHALNDHLKKKGIHMLRINLPGASHLMKEEKRGFIKGFSQRIRMYYDILMYNILKNRKN